MILMKNQTPSQLEVTSSIWGDFKLSFSLLKSNFKPIFWLCLIRIIVVYGVDHFFKFIIRTKLYRIFYRIPIPTINLIVSFFPSIISFGFWGAIIGLSYDIMSSGDGFAELKKSFYYIKKYWFRFVILSFLVNIVTFFLRYLVPRYVNFGQALLIRTFSFFWALLFFEISAALVSRNNFVLAFKDNFYLLSKHFLRILKMFTLYYLIFMVVRIFIGYSLYYLFPNDFIEYNTALTVLYVLNIVESFIGAPIFAFLSIGLYNEVIRYKNVGLELESSQSTK